MSLSSEDMMKLMAYADGELDGAERMEAEKLLATDPDSVRFVEQLGGLGELVELGYAAKTGKAVAKFDVADAVMALAKPAEKAASITSLAAAREKKKSGSAARNPAKVGVAVVAILALAASVFLIAQHRSDETPMAKGPAVQQATAQPAPEATVASNTGSGAGVDVSTVNSPGSSVSVFYLPTANELSTSIVVWVDETGEK